jgi:hypothetical protein
MKTFLIVALVIALLWAKYTKRESLFSNLRIAGLVMALIFLLERIFENS